jgi:uroporphyrinogen III methyltransferase/synthase
VVEAFSDRLGAPGVGAALTIRYNGRVAASHVSDTRALAGRRILVTRAAEQAGAFAQRLRDQGADVLVAPTIAIVPPESWAPLDAALARRSEFHWLVFTSVNGVAMVGSRLADHGLPWSALAGPRVAAIGPATAEALAARGLRAELVPDEYRAEALAARLRTRVRAGEKVLLPRAAEARDVLVVELERLGARVTEVPAYRTRPEPAAVERVRAALQRGQVDVVTFTSSSTARNFATLFSDEERTRLLRGVTIASIGPITAETAAGFGVPTHIMPDEYTIPALAGAIVGYFARTA